MSSIKKILTTHAGSLPRPKPLTQLYADRVAGLEIDESVLSDSCLLYTSPSPRDTEVSRMPSSA